MVDFWLDLFSPDTWEEARQRHFQVTGFRSSRWNTVKKIKKEDLFVCYLTKVSRFCGILKATSEPYYDENKAKKIWKHDSFPCLVDVEPIITLDILTSLPKDEIIPNLGNPRSWSGYVRGSPHIIPDSDGQFIAKALEKQKQEMREYPVKVRIRKPEMKEKRVKPSKQVYGVPMEFKGLRHAPLNEQGVLYVFALISRDIGFTVEAIGTAFPDCEAKRQIDRKGERWERVRVEFEYLSSEYRKHGHPIEGCDYIVCWRHDWLECPLKVVELSEEIKNLGARFEI